MILQRNSYYNLFLFQGLNLPYVSFQKLIILYQIKKILVQKQKSPRFASELFNFL
ncbi:hypothetical protein LEP1GSC079_2490 [Leptospira interrogans str. FPW1039]|uniref:Uncharacterized protein n=2 Tax=Leptospira interrogans TaxID=173 RepID=A0AAQ1P1V1_LEPIR|nr:hypothetical protein LEP1GSC045_4402 [Leptospira interrogans serovar Pomona str. Kennewicki LC82-25]EKN96873.1 hypothetical protein LEP1GSC014_1198 [Leptospira interrogans serovar Pomona str. Pomona]EKO71514.1 hypothetical protein LEP1GSC069_3464 [Leptospira interrogans serovar Canicola str. Fiocruz LV133]EKR26864.1 hypothetical protein LEP1GSC087_3755 [Leptospira interrogans serovar Bataviae str. L1111]EKR38383.1 hypothetical protein LEP1GSC096_1704 [Leptospira interrogans serovar Hebdomadi